MKLQSFFSILLFGTSLFAMISCDKKTDLNVNTPTKEITKSDIHTNISSTGTNAEIKTNTNNETPCTDLILALQKCHSPEEKLSKLRTSCVLSFEKIKQQDPKMANEFGNIIRECAKKETCDDIGICFAPKIELFSKNILEKVSTLSPKP